MRRSDLGNLIPRLADPPKGTSVEYFLQTAMTMEHVLVVLPLVWPDFCEIDGMVMLEDRRRSWEVSKAGGAKPDKGSQWVMNHIHLLEHFSVPTIKQDDVMAKQLSALGFLLKETWAAKLARDFPGRNFIVEFHPEKFDLKKDNPSISFWEEKWGWVVNLKKFEIWGGVCG